MIYEKNQYVTWTFKGIDDRFQTFQMSFRNVVPRRRNLQGSFLKIRLKEKRETFPKTPNRRFDTSSGPCYTRSYLRFCDEIVLKINICAWHFFMPIQCSFVNHGTWDVGAFLGLFGPQNFNAHAQPSLTLYIFLSSLQRQPRFFKTPGRTNFISWNFITPTPEQQVTDLN